MAQRESGYDRVARDAYMTPAWVTEVLVADLVARGLLPRRAANGVPLPIWEPAAGNGQMSGALAAAGFEVYASDIEPEGKGFRHDFLQPGDPMPLLLPRCGGIVTNPPYDRAEAFLERALALMRPAGGLVALLLNLDWDSARGRRHFFADCDGFALKLVLLDRITWFERLPEPGQREQGPSGNHAWFVWDFARAFHSPSIGYAEMPAAERKALAARRRERRVQADERDRQLNITKPSRGRAAAMQEGTAP